ncbi:MAG: hypothetical protein EOM70_11995 [Clostridia bacterium]|nr:hypothetical protein [Clostridia bacterium]
MIIIHRTRIPVMSPVASLCYLACSKLPDSSNLTGPDSAGNSMCDTPFLSRHGELIFDLANHSRLWINRGHTPLEMRTFAAPPSPTKPGRNDPCPCGSGKKYTQCCG